MHSPPHLGRPLESIIHHSLIGNLLFFFLCNCKIILIIKGILESMKYYTVKRNWVLTLGMVWEIGIYQMCMWGCQYFSWTHCWKRNLQFDLPNIGLIALSCFHYEKDDFFKRAHKSNEHESWWKQWVHTPIHTVNISPLCVNSLSLCVTVFRNEEVLAFQ